MVEAAGVGFCGLTENRELTDFTIRASLTIRTIRGFGVRVEYAA